jgi:hypothetical protein
LFWHGMWVFENDVRKSRIDVAVCRHQPAASQKY